MKTLIITLLALLFSSCGSAKAEVVVGAEQTERYLPQLEGQRVAVLANHTATVGNKHLVDMLVERGVNLVGIVSPEHGFRGTADAGEKVASSVDSRTGVPIWSLYSAQGRRLTDEQMAAFDVMLVDMQDVGLRFYTYYITMIDVINRCADFSRKVIVLDRPNPNGMYVDGPVLDMKYKSGVGALPIPVVHGLTMGEIAIMSIGVGWIKRADVEVVTCKGYTHNTRYTLPIAPSPNLKSQRAIYLYPSTCLFEGTACSLGRGTDAPFEMYGHPQMKDCNYTFTPRSTAGAKNPPLKDRLCYGVDLRGVDYEEVIAEGFNLDYIIDAYNRTGLGDKFFTPFFEKLVGVDYIRTMIIEGKSAQEISKCWQTDVDSFKILRRKYLLYQE
ncbi:MAG: DUF1343 domain-containing protein [Alistipes sp.]|nr:DUF1343 domain-containing protein [Alistipes sp.]